MSGIIGKKIGMTSIFGPDGKQISCTVIEAGPCVVTQVKSKAQYMRVQVMHKCNCVQMLNMAEWLNVLNILTSNLMELAEHGSLDRCC